MSEKEFGEHVPEDSEDFVSFSDPEPGDEDLSKIKSLQDDGEFPVDEPAVHPEIAKRQAQVDALAAQAGVKPHKIEEHQLNIEQSVGAPDIGPPAGNLEEIESRGMAERIVLEGVSEDFDAEFESGVNIPGLADDEHPEEADVEPSQGLLSDERDDSADRNS